MKIGDKVKIKDVTLEEQGKFALKHGFRWMDGCAALTPAGAVGRKRVIDADGYGDGRPVCDYEWGWCIEKHDLPDFSDPATLGCL
jgi:hypothetical protein